MPLKPLKISFLIFTFIISFVFAELSFAAGLPLGSSCNSNSDCASGDCKDSSKNASPDDFCHCYGAQSCYDAYGAPTDGGEWECTGGADATWGLDYCQSTAGKDVRTPIPPKDPSFIDSILDPTLTAKTMSEIDKIIQSPQTKINIPGLKFSTPEQVKEMVKEEGGSTYLYLPFVGEYLAAAYKYVVIFAGIFAVVMIMNHGFGIVVSGGIPEKIQHSKKRMAQAVTGLLLAVGSYVLLYAINPELVQFRNLKVLYVQKLSVEDIVGDLTVDLTPLDETITPIPTKDVPLFKQTKNSGQPWWNTPFGACGTIQTSGCGPTSLAMVLKKYGHDVNPAVMAKEWADLGYRKCPASATASQCSGCGNTGHGGMFADKTFLEKYKMKSTSLGTDKDKIVKTLQQGKPVIVSMSKSIFTGAAHFIVLTGVNSNGSISVNDSNKNAYCSNGETKCAADLQTIKPGVIPSNLVFPFIKAATLIEPK